jgi:hypothetical protein
LSAAGMKVGAMNHPAKVPLGEIAEAHQFGMSRE